jgi:hypothetical protein
MARNPFDFLDAGSSERTLLVLLLALIRKSGGELELSIPDLTAINEGDSFVKYPSDSGTSLVLRFARKGAEAYFLAEAPSASTNPSSTRSTVVTKRSTPLPSRPSPATWGMTSPMDPSTAPLNQPSEASTPPTIEPRPLPRHAMHTDLDDALLEEEMAQRAAQAARRRQQQARAESGTLPWRTVKPQ